jgi:hypothetical protein
MEKAWAFLTHLLCSVAVVGIFLLVVSLIWYPAPYLEMSGVFSVLAILVMVDVVLGPLMTAIIYKPGKPGLKMDIGLIVTVQIAAFLYGANAIYSQRPAYVVFVVDRFEVMSAADVEGSGSPPPELTPGLFSGPLLVYSSGPEDPIKAGEILLGAAQGGNDVSAYPEYYQPYDKRVNEILSRTRPVKKLISSGKIDKELIRDLSGGFSLDSIGYIPVVGRNKVMSMMINPTTGIPMGTLDIEIW